MDVFSPAERSHVDIISDSLNNNHDFIEQVERRRSLRINKKAIQPHCAALVDAVLRNSEDSKKTALSKYQKSNKQNDERADIFSGAFFVGCKAVELSLADDIGDFESFIEQKSYKYGVVRNKETYNFLQPFVYGNVWMWP